MDDPDYQTDLRRAEQQIQQLLATIDHQAALIARLWVNGPSGHDSTIPGTPPLAL